MSTARADARRGLLYRAAVAAAFGAVGAITSCARGPAPGRDLARVASALGSAAQGAEVSPDELRWEPSAGAAADAVLGRWVLFLARSPGEDTRDVWRARARTTPEGGVVEVTQAYDLTRTPLGDEHALVVARDHAAFATRAYGQDQGATLLDLGGEGALNRAETLLERAMAAVTNLQLTGSEAGLGRLDLSFETPAAEVALELEPARLDLALYDRGAPRPRVATFDFARGEVAGAQGVHAEPTIHLPKRLSHWVVDTLRAIPWIGPAPIAWVEDVALGARDAYRRTAFQANGGATDVVATAEPPPPLLDTSEASLEEAHWPPPKIESIWKEGEAGEGEWVVPEVPWLRRVTGASADAPPCMYTTFVRPDEERPYSKVLLVAMDTRQLDLDMEAGIEDPEPLTGPHGSGRIPRDPAVYRRVAAAFNGAFKTEHGHYGMMVHGRVLLPPVPGAATVIVTSDGRAGFGSWGADHKLGGLVGVPDDSIVSFRQNLEALLDKGQVNPTGRNLWGFTLPGKGAQTERTGLCVTTSGHMLYAWGDDVSATALAKAMRMGGCDYAMHLDMNPYHTGFLFTAIDDLASKKYHSQLLTTSMSIPVERYIQYAPKDFFYVMVRSVVPEAIEGRGDAAGPWEPDGGSQPPPKWMPGLWSTHLDGPSGTVELLDVEPDRATWRVRAGTAESPAAAPLRELGTGDAKRALLAVTAGVAPERHPGGLTTGGKVAVPVRPSADSAVLVVGASGKLTLARSTDPVSADLGSGDLVELPVALWDGKPVVATAGAVERRAALGVTPTGRVVIARATLASVEPLAEALARTGCTRAVALDRGTKATATLDRAGTANAPRVRYDETVVVAIATPMPARAFRFEAATTAVQPKGR